MRFSCDSLAIFLKFRPFEPHILIKLISDNKRVCEEGIEVDVSTKNIPSDTGGATVKRLPILSVTILPEVSVTYVTEVGPTPVTHKRKYSAVNGDNFLYSITIKICK